jgi:hypothetical protein
MALTNAYVQIYGQLPEVFQRLSAGQAPEKFTTQHLKDLGFGSSNYRAVIPLLKALGFLTSDGTPTQKYHEYRNLAQSKKVLGEAIREAYSDLFTIKSHPTNADRDLIEGKFKSVHNATTNTAKLMANTFYSLLGLADVSVATEQKKEKPVENIPPDPAPNTPIELKPPLQHQSSLHYNIQIHLPATKDVEVFNAIFKALREHLLA